MFGGQAVVEAPRDEVTMAERASRPASAFSDEWISEHLEVERRRSGLLGEIREAIFGAQDGLVSTLAVVSTVGGATNDRFAILVAGIAAALAGVFSMAAGEFMSSRSQREIFEQQISDELDEVHQRPGEAQAEVAYMFREEGLPRDESDEIAAILARHPPVLLKTMVEKELGLAVEESGGSPLQGAIVMGAAFGLGAAVPVVPYLLLPVDSGIIGSLIGTGLVLFLIGVVKSRWTGRGALVSGLEILALAAFAGIAGYFFGNILPTLLGRPDLGV
jgi:VIT1/CCC1 family predicted Fe2+/Mn2+ transporter